MEIGGIALRDAILVVSGLAGVYLVFLILRVVQLGRRKSDDFEVDADSAAERPQDEESDLDPEEEDVPSVYGRPAVASAPGPFGAELTRSHQELEARQLREEVAELRAELAELRGDMAEIKAARNVSPQYADAMAFAQRGLTAQDVADRCGISLGEAELVWALSRGPTNFDEEEGYDGDSGRRHAKTA